MNISELLLEKIASVTLTSIEDDSLAVRLTTVKDGNLQTSAEGTTVTDNIGATIMNLYNAKTAVLTGTNALFNADLGAVQFGDEKQVATEDAPIIVPTYESIDAVGGKLTLEKEPIADSVKYVYKLVNNGIAEKLTLATGQAGDKSFTINAKEITLPSGSTGTYYVEYEYESTTANKLSNKSDKFPGVYKARVYVVMRDACNKNKIYTGVIVSNRAEIDPSTIEIGLNAEAGHAFTINFNKEYCSKDTDLFSIIIDE